ncbi:hypothetical protein [Bacillus swezeyi]|uniref:Uncharacterized protein n=1 Tax=Bacillus swezeyi TaxID=1925020 RepID=A0A5M8RWS4_9BACI|nr:hypothetical protein [Bacillus swezeyi]KAA6451830.1 hypothetical protein DX927_14025 [Bacillus swezeyi]TYS36054.1 hypothetical protein FZC77_13490 [Bacillus swezeyi]
MVRYLIKTLIPAAKPAAAVIPVLTSLLRRNGLVHLFLAANAVLGLFAGLQYNGSEEISRRERKSSAN